MSGIGSIWHWLILLLIVGLVFGTKRLRHIGDDLGVAIKGFRKGLRDSDDRTLPKADAAARPEDAEIAAQRVQSK